jgi:hypothetical protein
VFICLLVENIKGFNMPNVYIEARPKGRPEGSPVEDYVVEDHADHVLSAHKTQQEAIDWAKKQRSGAAPERQEEARSLAWGVAPFQRDRHNATIATTTIVAKTKPVQSGKGLAPSRRNGMLSRIAVTAKNAAELMIRATGTARKLIAASGPPVR